MLHFSTRAGWGCKNKAVSLPGKQGVVAAMKLFIGMASLLISLAAITDLHAADDKIAVVAAENFYGDVAQQIGGDRVAVTSILSNPDQDPHLFETSPSVVRAIIAAQVALYNGADYDPWMKKLLDASPQTTRSVIVAADLLNKKAGDNPHLWYDPPTMPAVARALAAALSAADPAHRDEYADRLQKFLASLQPLDAKIAALGSKFDGLPVTATEPVFGYMAAALHLTMKNEHFQLAVMNDTEPSPREVAAFEHDLATHSVRAIFYNKQASSNLVRHLIDRARASKIPVVGVTETCPAGVSYQQWMLSELDATEKALAGPSS
jgi:zinc/manganese transport system substrate-binding protein